MATILLLGQPSLFASLYYQKRESEWIPGVGDGQGGLACCDSWGRKESDTTELLNWTELSYSYGRKWRGTKEPLDESERGDWKVGLKFNIQKMIRASGPITSWQIDGESIETVTDFIFLGSKITADSDGSHKIKRCLLLGRKAMKNLDSILKKRDITWPTKVL